MGKWVDGQVDRCIDGWRLDALFQRCVDTSIHRYIDVSAHRSDDESMWRRIDGQMERWMMYERGWFWFPTRSTATWSRRISRGESVCFISRRTRSRIWFPGSLTFVQKRDRRLFFSGLGHHSSWHYYHNLIYVCVAVWWCEKEILMWFEKRFFHWKI